MSNKKLITGNLEIFLLGGWITIALILRLTALEGKPPWADEFSTLVFSLGNSFRGIPLNEVISLDTLLEPLEINPLTTYRDVIRHLITESNHPPVYFVLLHWWMNLFNPAEGYVSLWVARSLPAFFGVLSVPAIYHLAKLTYSSPLVRHFAAAMMAVSPYAIYLAQETRHYTLALLFVIASLGCFVKACEGLNQGKSLPISLGFIWIFINCLGIAIHYFFSLTLCAEVIVLGVIFLRKGKEKIGLKPGFIASFILPIVGSLMGCLVWLPVFYTNSYGSKLTQWIQGSDRVGFAWISPVVQAISGWVPMISLLPIESASFAQYPLMVISFSLLMGAFFFWVIPLFITGLRQVYQNAETRFSTSILGGFVISAIVIFFSLTYLFNIDLTKGARYNFTYFPAVIILLGSILAWMFKQERVKSQWFQLPAIAMNGQKAVFLIWLMGVSSGITVIANFGYQKFYKPDALVTIIKETSTVPLLIATPQKTHVEIGELMGIAWQWKKEEARGKTEEGVIMLRDLSLDAPKFLLVNHNQTNLLKTVEKLAFPIDLWLVNFPKNQVDLDEKKCQKDTQSRPSVDGYSYQLYHCLK